ncbi:MAG: hypothetical protein PHT94_01565 [Candidatus Nanoarchaeia archaeon]|nr:hypothetical protein [Candidatus Nanoarchaeia archaeon]
MEVSDLPEKLLVCVDVAGPEVIPILKYLYKRKNVSEFLLSEKLDVDVHILRTVLYKLYNEGLISYKRKKDRIKGWYIHYWSLNMNRLDEVRMKKLKEQLEKLQERLDSEKTHIFYICPSFCSRFDFDGAIETEFKCPECGSLLKQQENEKTVVYLEKKIESILEELQKLENEKLDLNSNIENDNNLETKAA